MRAQIRTQNCPIKISRNNPQTGAPSHKNPTNVTQAKSPIISRKAKGVLDESICFISPKKIGYFQGIDESCLNESQRTILKGQCQKTESSLSSLNLNQSEIDYRSIKKCLSPRSVGIQSQSEKVIKSLNPSMLKKPSQKLKDTIDAQFKQRLILDLKMEILQMGVLLEEKQKVIEEKDIRISELQRELWRYQVNQSTSLSIKSISTIMEERTPSILNSFSLLNIDQSNDKICEMQQRIRNYEHQFKKFQIEIDILKKYRYQRQKDEAQMIGTIKKNESLNRRINRLMQKNSRLAQELQKYKCQALRNADSSLILQYSPEKHLQ